MAEARDRLSRNENLMAMFARQQRSIQDLGTLDESAEESSVRTPFRWGNTPMTGHQGLVRVRAATGRGGNGVWRGRLRSPIRAIRPRRIIRGQGRGTNLPSWYPRRPLGDITAITRAIQRRRESLGEAEGLQLETPTSIRAQPVHSPSFTKTPNSIDGKGLSCPCPPSVAKILLDVTSKRDEGENSDCLTPQRKLLNSIDIVGKAVMEELEKLNKTPSAKRVARERKMRTLMSMR